MKIDLSSYSSAIKQNKKDEYTINAVDDIESPNKNNGYQFGKLSGTLFDVAGDVATGFGKGIEGIVDWGVLGLIGIAGEIFGSDNLVDAMEKASKYDVAGNTIGKIDYNLSQNSFLNNDSKFANTIHQVGSGIGMMLPSIAVTVASGGTASPAAVAAGMATFGAGAAGVAQEEALNEGASIGEAFAYGTVSGMAEVAIEYASAGLGKIAGKMLGKNGALFGSVMPQTGKGFNGLFKSGTGKAAGELIVSFLEEGGEEVASEFLNPLWKSLTYKKGEYETPEMEDLLNSFVVGGVTALAMGGGTKLANYAMYGIDGTKYIELKSELEELNASELELEKQGKLTEDVVKENDKRRKEIAEEFVELGEKIKNSNRHVDVIENTDVETPLAFNAKKQVVYEAIKRINKNYKTSLSVEFVTDKKMSELRKENNDKSIINGYYDIKNNKIVINENSTDPYSVVVAHEITHSTENNQLYNDISNEILSTMSQEEISNYKAELKKVYGDKISDSQLNKEIVANYISEMLGSDSKTLLRTFTRKPNVVTRVLEWLESKVSSSKQNNAESKAIISLRNKVRNLLSQNNVVESDSELGVEYSKKDALIELGYYEASYQKLIDNGIDADAVLNSIKKKYKSGGYKYKNSSIVYDDYLVFYDIQDSVADITGCIDLLNLQEKFGLTNEEYREFKRNLDYMKWNGGNFNAKLTKLITGARQSSLRDSGNSDVNIQVSGKEKLGNDNGISSKQSFSGREENTGVVEESNQLEDSRKARKPPKGQLELDLSFGELTTVENNPIVERVETKTINESTSSYEELYESVLSKVNSKAPKTNKSMAEKVESAKETVNRTIENREQIVTDLQAQLTNSFAGIEKEVNKKIKEKYSDKKTQEYEFRKFQSLLNKTHNTETAAGVYIKDNLWNKIFKKIQSKGEQYSKEFDAFLTLRVHIKRTQTLEKGQLELESLEKSYKNGLINLETYNSKKSAINEEMEDIKNNPVFPEVTVPKARRMLKDLEAKHPEFVEYASEVYSYLDVLMQSRLKTGLVNEQQVKFMKDYYTENGENWYVPTYREKGTGTSALSGNGKVGVSKGIHRAKGSDKPVQSVFVSISQQTAGVFKQGAMNELFQEVYKWSPDSFQPTTEKTRPTREDVDGVIEPKNDEIFFYQDGVRNVYKVNGTFARAFDSLRNVKSLQWEENIVAKGLAKSVSIMKKLTTEWNPFFAVRNLFRDASDAFIYTKYSKNLIKRYNRALKEIRTNGKLYKLYIENGGENYSFFDKEHGLDLTEKNKILSKITALNETTELLPRLSEFIESIENNYTGDFDKIPQHVIDMAMLDASEVTVNFARGGTFTKKLNKYLMPYLNASIQGWCKTWNTFVHPTSMRAWCYSMAKVAMLALPTLIFNEIWFDDDEEYQQLSDDIKGSYFLIKVGNNKFIRIPRGRVEAVVGDAMQRIYRTTKGEEDAFDGYIENTVKNVSPVDNLTRTILSPITDINTNTTWYGGQIENQSMQSLPINERYDANTSEIAKIMNKVVPSVSPKKWHYLLEQYSGILGDVVLPLTSKNKDLSGISGLTANSLENNKYTNKYYDVMEELEQKKNSANGTAVDKAKMRYFNNANTKIRELYQAKKTSTDKEEQLAIQAMIVKLQKTTLEGVSEFGKVLDKYSYGLSQEELYEDYYREATRECFGAEMALLNYDSRVYEKATIFNKCGINWDTFYNIYFDVQDISADYDADGKVINGSKKEKVTKYVKSLKLTSTQKYMVMGLLGYKNANGESQVRSFLRSKGYSGEELENIMKICGYDN